ncbi:interleukin-20 receptor subunit alpha [Melanotaenia boesemani]|uniref:interleukin-20 receptor subunit alpha n=1 Tax=Melanotaenia boesemani TaxID=1250792 RepID=UPI001C042D52|nr:interleukin-20 receptor subunit alpha [Melanotaenia boesemani]
MWTPISFIYLLGLYCAASTTLPSPTNVSFSSVNLRNVLHWSPGNGTPDDIHFTVEYAIYGDSVKAIKGRRMNWRAVPQCTNIIRTWCDLTKETRDVEQGYYARVHTMGRRSSSKWAVTLRFDPKSDTTFGPPWVSLEIVNNSAIITLTGPMRYPPNNHTKEVSMAEVYPQMRYNLSIYNTHRDQMHHIPVATNWYKYHLQDYNTEYCFSAKSKFLSLPVECQASAWHCITTPQDPMIEQLQKMVVGIVVLSSCICIIMLVGYLLYNYLTGRGQKTPYMLNPPCFHQLPLMLPPDNLKPLPISIKIKSSSDTLCPDPAPHTVYPTPSFLPQVPEAPLQPEEPRDDYGSVLVAPVVNRKEEEGREIRHDGDNGNSLTGEHQQGIDRGNRKDKNDEDGIYARQAKPCLLDRKTYTFRQTPMPTHGQKEVSTHMQAHPWSQVKSALPTQQLQCCQESVTAELNIREDGGKLPGLFISKSPQTGLFNVIPNLQTQRDVDEQGEVARKIDVSEEKGSECENVPLLSAYALQDVKNMPMCHPNQSHCLADDYGLLAAAQKTEEAHFDNDEEEEGTICINWNPETRKLVLPEMEMGFKKGGLNELTHSEREDRIAGKNDKMYMSRFELQLESVFVRQTSEEEAEAQRVLQRGGVAGWEVDDFLTAWGLIIPTDQ